MPTETEIANKSLDYVGAKSITSLGDLSNSARAVSSAWPLTRRSCLVRHLWKFAKRRETLAPLSTTPAYGWSYQYQLPGDFIRVHTIGETVNQLEPYELEGGKILYDGASLKMIYIRDEQDTSLWSPSFVELFAARLACDISFRLTGSHSIYDRLKVAVDETSKISRFIDSVDDYRKFVVTPDFMQSRKAASTFRMEDE